MREHHPAEGRAATGRGGGGRGSARRGTPPCVRPTGRDDKTTTKAFPPVGVLVCCKIYSSISNRLNLGHYFLEYTEGLILGGRSDCHGLLLCDRVILIVTVPPPGTDKQTKRTNHTRAHYCCLVDNASSYPRPAASFSLLRVAYSLCGSSLLGTYSGSLPESLFSDSR